VRIYYRTRQFWHELRLSPTTNEMDRARSVLSSAQLDLFIRLQPGEQSHSLAVFNKLCAAGEDNHDLLVAALLHDVGKTSYPLKLWERVWIVIANAVFSRFLKRWALGDLENLKDLSFWKRPLVVAEQHPKWGAELAAQSGSSPLVVSLIRRHQDTLVVGDYSSAQKRISASGQNDLKFLGFEDCLLQKLQAADDES
jgi:putative nucleotidyltransferase with HDIG domain